MWCDIADCRGKVKTNASVLFCALFVQHLLSTSLSQDKGVITTTTFFIRKLNVPFVISRHKFYTIICLF